jgi:GAF domain-containing protein
MPVVLCSVYPRSDVPADLADPGVAHLNKVDSGQLPRVLGRLLRNRMAESAGGVYPASAKATLLRLAAAALVGHGADMATAQICRSDGALILVAGIGFDRPFLDHFAVVADDKTACAAASVAAAAIEVVDVATDACFDEPARQAVLAAGSRACISVPVVDLQGTVLGVVSAHYRQPGKYDATSVQSIADDVASCFALAD